MPRFALAFLSALLAALLLTACSPSNESDEPEYNDTETGYEEDDEEPEEEPWNPAQDGYRKGRMTITFLVEQAGALHKRDNTPGDPTRTDIEWSFLLKAKREMAVWVSPDLRFRFPESADLGTQLNWLKSEPYFVLANDALIKEYQEDGTPVQDINAEGEISFSSRFVYARPNAADEVLTEKISTAVGRPVRLEIEDMVPSILGHGYQVKMVLSEEYSGQSINNLTYQNGRKETFTEVLSPDSEREIKFEPTLKEGPIMPYPMEGEQEFPEIAARNREILNEMLAGLRQGNFAQRLFAGMIAGMKTEDSADALTLHYRNEGGEGVPLFFGVIEIMGAPMSKNVIDFKVEITLLD